MELVHMLDRKVPEFDFSAFVLEHYFFSLSVFTVFLLHATPTMCDTAECKPAATGLLL